MTTRIEEAKETVLQLQGKRQQWESLVVKTRDIWSRALTEYDTARGVLERVEDELRQAEAELAALEAE